MPYPENLKFEHKKYVKVNKVKLLNKLAEIRTLMEYDISKAKQKLTQLQNNLILEKGDVYI